jgi:hypothetical protein
MSHEAPLKKERAQRELIEQKLVLVQSKLSEQEDTTFMCAFPAKYLAFLGHRLNRFHVEDLRENSLVYNRYLLVTIKCFLFSLEFGLYRS